MNQEGCKYYRFGYSGCNFLRIDRSVYIQSELLPNGIIREIKCDKDDKWMKVRERKEESKEWNEINVNGVRTGVTKYLGDSGYRWEGDFLNGSPFGCGCIYNSKNQLIYHGFIFEKKQVCYGMEMYGDVGIVEYEGGFYNGKRYGYGKLYNKENELIYEGEWYMNIEHPQRSILLFNEIKEEDIHFKLESIEIHDCCLKNINRLILTDFHCLKEIKIKKNSLESINNFVISDCNELGTVELYGIECRNVEIDNIDGKFEIRNCRILQEIKIGNNWYEKCERAKFKGIIDIDKEIMKRSSKPIFISDRF